MEIKTFVFLDLETTGLPHLENNTTKITELSLISVQAEHILLGVIPRVQNKLNLCFNPWKMIQERSEELTGLSNELLENESSFNESTLNILINFFERMQKPICFVAHNGNRFDYPILRAHMDKLNPDVSSNIFAIDTLNAFREILSGYSPTNVSPKNFSPDKMSESSKSDTTIGNSVCDLPCINVSIDMRTNWGQQNQNKKGVQALNETTPVKNITASSLYAQFKGKSKSDFEKVSGRRESSEVRRKLDFGKKSISYKLVDIYERVLGKEAVGSHQAEADTLMILEIATHLGERFVDWANANAILFTKIPKMTPGKRL